jgi:hypothetical protein
MQMSHQQFIAWANQTFHRAYFASAWPCWSWRINGVLVTLWLPKDCAYRVIIYRERGAKTMYFDSLGELCRKYLYQLASEPRH